MPNLIFLDFDGVLHSVDDFHTEYSAHGIRYSGANLFRHLPLLAGILDRFPEVDVVVSSSWRHHYSLDELREIFGRHGERIIGTIRSIDVPGERPATRFQECRTIAEEFEARHWLMIDDQPTLVWGWYEPSESQERRVIFCDPKLGLSTPGVIEQIHAQLEIWR
jgi:hypothetical protein